MFQALSEKGAEKSSSPESCQHSRHPLSFFSREKTYNLKRPSKTQLIHYAFRNCECWKINIFFLCLFCFTSFCEQTIFFGNGGCLDITDITFFENGLCLCLPQPATVAILHMASTFTTFTGPSRKGGAAQVNGDLRGMQAGRTIIAAPRWLCRCDY